MKTNALVDDQCNYVGSKYSYLALTADTNEPDPTHTTLAGELTDDGLARVEATFAHTDGQNTYTLTHQFTYAGDTEVVVAKIGVFDAASDGVLGFETLLNSSAALANNGDQLTITQTVTA